MQQLQELALHAHSEVEEETPGCLMCGKSYDQVIEETTANYLHETAEPGKTIRERHFKRQAFITGLQSGVRAFIPRGMSQAAACDGIIYNPRKLSTVVSRLK